MALQIDVFQVEEKGFYVRVVCNKGQGVAASLYKALDSFSSFIVQSSNLATADKNFVLTFTLNVSFVLLQIHQHIIIIIIISPFVFTRSVLKIIA